MLPTFSELDLVGANNVVVRAGRAQSVVVRGDDNLLGHITTRVEAGTLVIRTKGRFTTKSPMSVGVNVPSLEALTLAGAGKITVQNLHARQLTVTLTGTGVVRATGTVGRLQVTLVGTGDAQLRALAARDVRATLTGTGQIAVSPKRRLDASIVGVGTILYSGKPATVTTNITGSGAVVKG
ncbi:MAG: head GIN domain-containing protein [Solirubrobacteraceae bacterium]